MKRKTTAASFASSSSLLYASSFSKLLFSEKDVITEMACSFAKTLRLKWKRYIEGGRLENFSNSNSPFKATRAKKSRQISFFGAASI